MTGFRTAFKPPSKFVPSPLSGIPVLRLSRKMDGSSLRKCQSIKSRKHKNAPCTSVATHGDFCSRHGKNPIRYIKPTTSIFPNRILTRSDTIAVLRIQKFWIKWAAQQRYKRQGPAMNNFEVSQNQTEIYSLDTIQSIPKVFFFSFADMSKTIWSFDIRSLSHLLTEGTEPVNPYTRQMILPSTLKKIHERLQWLRKRKYPILHMTGENLTQEQIWNQKVLDVFFKMDALGYRASCRWFEDMEREDHELFFARMYRLWTYQLGLTVSEKEAILPGPGKLFKQTPDKTIRSNHDIRWWRRSNLNMIVEFLIRGTTKSHQALGALYVLMALVQVVPEAAEAYPWILETVQ